MHIAIHITVIDMLANFVNRENYIPGLDVQKGSTHWEYAEDNMDWNYVVPKALLSDSEDNQLQVEGGAMQE